MNQNHADTSPGHPESGRPHHHHPGGPPKKRPWIKTHGRDLKFILIFALVLGAYYFAATTKVATEQFFPWYLRINASASVWVLNVIGYDEVRVNNQAVLSPGFRMQIERGCDAVDPSALFVAAVLASPVGLLRKIPAVVVGIGLLLLLNIVRIVTLYVTGVHFRKFFDTMHLEVWQAAFIVMALLFWAIWASRYARRKVKQAHAAA